MQRRSKVTAVLAAMVVLASSSLVADGQEAECVATAPSDVVAGGTDAPGSPGTNRVRHTFDLPYPISYGPDAGPGSIMTEPDGSVIVVRANGVVRFRQPGVRLWAGGVGDPDGVLDIGVFVLDDDWSVGVGPAFLVSGNIAPGTWDPAEVGVAVGEGAAFSTVDRDGDEIADLMLIDHDGTGYVNGRTHLVSGAAVLAAEPGTAVPANATFATMPGTLLGYARVDGQSPTALGNDRSGRLVTGSQTADEAHLYVGDGTDYVDLTTSPEALVPHEPATGIGLFDAWIADEDPLLSLVRSAPPEPGSTTYWWALGECGAAPSGTTQAWTGVRAPAPQAPPPPPAAPLPETALPVTG